MLGSLAVSSSWTPIIRRTHLEETTYCSSSPPGSFRFLRRKTASLAMDGFVKLYPRVTWNSEDGTCTFWGEWEDTPASSRQRNLFKMSWTSARQTVFWGVFYKFSVTETRSVRFSLSAENPTENWIYNVLLNFIFLRIFPITREIAYRKWKKRALKQLHLHFQYIMPRKSWVISDDRRETITISFTLSHFHRQKTRHEDKKVQAPLHEGIKLSF